MLHALVCVCLYRCVILCKCVCFLTAHATQQAMNRKLQRDYADLSEQIYEAEQAKTILVDEKAAALVRQNAEFLQLQEELALALTECEANVAALRISERLNTQLREDLDKMRGDVELLVASGTERMTLAASVATLEDDGKATTAELEQLSALQTERASKAEAALSMVQQRVVTLETRLEEMAGEQDAVAQRTAEREEMGKDVLERLTSDKV